MTKLPYDRIKKSRASLIAMTALSLSACSTLGGVNVPNVANKTQIAAPVPVVVKADKFTYANYDVVQVQHLDLNLDVNFDEKILDGVATLDFKRLDPGATQLVLDTKGLSIDRVTIPKGNMWVEADYTLSDADAMMGQAMTIDIGTDIETVKIDYKTSPSAEGLQWLSPEQTAGKQYPYLFSQAQAINARTMAPVQDTPAVRITYTATLRTPPELLALMSADQDPYTPRDGEYTFSMPQPVPAYLLAIAVGDIDFKPINDTIGVYAEDYILDASVREFSETPDMEVANEKLYGPYRWGRYDLIVLPPSFPYGGMENPRLSFLTPTLVAGDKSLTNVVAHELAHSWSGNLVTNSSWRDAWLNEGFTSYVENRVMEDLYGEGRAVMEQALAMDDLKRDIAGAARPELTQLKLPEDIQHPDDAFSQVAYVKGQFFLIFLEERFGREAFDPFLRNYFDKYAFKSVTTEDFLGELSGTLREAYPDAVTDDEINEWVYQPGLPSTVKVPESEAFDKVEALSSAWELGLFELSDFPTQSWSTHEWLHFINTLPSDLTPEQFMELDEAFYLTGTQNAEIAFAWYMQAIGGGYDEIYPALEEFLLTVGRGKFIYRLYGALTEQDSDKQQWAKDVYEEARPGYHPIAQRRIDAIVGVPDGVDS